MSPLLLPPSTSLLGPTWAVRLMKKKTDMSRENTTVAHMKVPNCLKKVSAVGSRNMDAPKLGEKKKGASNQQKIAHATILTLPTHLVMAPLQMLTPISVAACLVLSKEVVRGEWV